MARTAPFVGICVFVSILSIVALAQTQSPYPPAQPKRLVSDATSAARGEQLVMLGGCNDCHTPKLPGGRLNVSRLLSGQPLGGPVPPAAPGAVTTNMHLTAWRGPWGVSLSRNITPENETGIGTWSLADFKRTIRTGVDPKGQVLNPPMPIPTLQNLPDEDLEAIYNYLRTVKAVRNDTSGKAAPLAKSTK
jgi:mono/diheme cytochrome c family protein